MMLPFSSSSAHAPQPGKGAYTAGEPDRVNVTKESRRSKVKWRQWIDPGTPVPTGVGAG